MLTKRYTHIYIYIYIYIYATMSGWFISRNQRRTAETLVSRTRSQCETSGISASGRATRAIVRGYGTHREPRRKGCKSPSSLMRVSLCTVLTISLVSWQILRQDNLRNNVCGPRERVSPLLHEIHLVFAISRNASQREHRTGESRSREKTTRRSIRWRTHDFFSLA